MPQLPTTKTAQISLAVFVVMVLILDGFAARELVQDSALLGFLSPAASQVATATSTRATVATTTNARTPAMIKAEKKALRAEKAAQRKLKKMATSTQATSTPPKRAAPPPAEVVPPPVEEPVVSPEPELPPEEPQPPVEDLWPLEDIPSIQEFEWPVEELQPQEEVPEPSVVPYAPEPAAPSKPVEVVPQKAASKAAAPQVVNTLPDLYVREVTLQTKAELDNIPPNQSISITLLIGNSGSRDARPATTLIGVDEQADGTWDHQVTVAAQGAVSANNTQRIVALNAIRKTVSGKTIVAVCADSGNTVVEANEKNNCRAVSFTVAAAVQTPAKTPSPVYSAYQSVLGFFGGLVR